MQSRLTGEIVCIDWHADRLNLIRDMNGRYFGGRKISASFFDEDKFDRNDLAPVAGEW